ncbi:tRNA (guanosine(46)-N7)-methyltransferase TrmB [Devosia sp. RR2S18]|uniref:tRNA (guanosine(46)-N7)-methyltransferase TrmB n=1 Tax=Devosia rhizosphaerae TaxID=3049774 RepID=UPI0025419F74|nr:tRNA (guanosine(46)-N7)-methyltransferase TrmB [Devosia sp. RR2S18]WIJ25315.1 tRNA (guanosine(46)-N7)-methyltransferase TrmB [Devosia sp. RR2S18]
MTDHELPKTRSGEPRAFFGRRSGKKLHGGQQAVFDATLPQLEIKLEGPLNPRSLFPDAERIVVEIGYGGGEHLARQAAENPKTGFIGCEVFTGGIGKMVQTIAGQELRNIRLFTDDALKLLVQLPEGSIDEVYLLYPDPWPKTRHHKRRFVSPTTLGELARVIREGGKFHFATDIEDYANWTLAHIVRQPLFSFEPERPGSWHEPYSGWQATRYEQKARREGRMTSFYFTFNRT